LIVLKNNTWVLLQGFCELSDNDVKSFATAITLGSGGNGGNFAPSLFVGSYIGFVSFAKSSSIKPDLPIYLISNFTMVGWQESWVVYFMLPLTA
jgi:CIC family chloride channel protein